MKAVLKQCCQEKHYAAEAAKAAIWLAAQRDELWAGDTERLKQVCSLRNTNGPVLNFCHPIPNKEVGYDRSMEAA